MQQMTTFPSRCLQNDTIPHQKIIPFSFKKTPSYMGSGLVANNLTPSTPSSSYSMPMYYDDESRSSSGFQSADSSYSNRHRNGGKLNLMRNNIQDCVVWYENYIIFFSSVIYFFKSSKLLLFVFTLWRSVYILYKHNMDTCIYLIRAIQVKLHDSFNTICRYSNKKKQTLQSDCFLWLCQITPRL
jgi:hypothetical protein